MYISTRSKLTGKFFIVPAWYRPAPPRHKQTKIIINLNKAGFVWLMQYEHKNTLSQRQN